MRKRRTQHTYISHLRSLFQTPSVQYVFAARTAPHRAIVVSNRSGNYQLHAVDFSTGFKRQITHAAHGALFGSISSNGRYIYTLNDESGSEHGHFVRIPFDGGHTEDMTPDLKKYFSYSLSTNDDGKVFCFTAALDNKNSVFILNEDGGGDRVIRKRYISDYSLSESVCSPDGTFVCVAKTDSKAKTSTMLLLSAIDNTVTLRSRRFTGAAPLAFSCVSTQTTILALARSRDWYRPVFYDFTRNRTAEIQHATFRGDVWVLGWNEKRALMILCETYHARQKLYLYNTHTRRLKRLGPKTGSFNFHFDSAIILEDGSLVLKWQDFNSSPRLIKIHAPRYDAWEEIPEWSNRVASKYAIEEAWGHSSDGKRVHMWVTRPHITSKPIPFVIDVHGGPHGVVGDEFSPEAQVWLQNGFGYCAVNYRGSIGFGRKFERKIYGNPGKWEVEDIVAARNWLVRKKYADPKSITLYGWSWGGYITLLALGKYPELWNCGIAGAAIADCIMQYEDEPAYFKTQDQERFGGTPTTAFLRYIRSSPITYADRIQAPILLLHGKNDTRCPVRQINHFINTLHKLKKSISVRWFASGHTGEFTDIILRTKLMDKTIQFACNAQRKALSKNLS